VPEPVPESVPEPVPESVPEPVPESVPEPVPKVTANIEASSGASENNVNQAKENCQGSGGKWDGSSCDCKGKEFSELQDGKCIDDEDAKNAAAAAEALAKNKAKCESAGRGGYNAEAGDCECRPDQKKIDTRGSCETPEQTACLDSGGGASWDGEKCSCSDNAFEPKNGKCEKKSDNQISCEDSEGTWTNGACNCGEKKLDGDKCRDKTEEEKCTEKGGQIIGGKCLSKDQLAELKECRDEVKNLINSRVGPGSTSSTLNQDQDVKKIIAKYNNISNDSQILSNQLSVCEELQVLKTKIAEEEAAKEAKKTCESEGRGWDKQTGSCECKEGHRKLNMTVKNSSVTEAKHANGSCVSLEDWKKYMFLDYSSATNGTTYTECTRDTSVNCEQKYYNKCENFKIENFCTPAIVQQYKNGCISVEKLNTNCTKFPGRHCNMSIDISRGTAIQIQSQECYSFGNAKSAKD
jgi:hypothetical protein